MSSIAGSFAGVRGNLSRCWDFLRFVIRHFEEDNCRGVAASLTYTSLLSMVPLMTVMFSTLAAFPVFDGLEQDIEAFVFNNFVPASGETLRRYLHEFSDKAAGLRLAGFLFLFVTVLSMMSTIEITFNRIWRVRSQRKPLTRFMTYWAILTLGPFLVGLGFALTSYLVSLPVFSEVDATLEVKKRMLTIIPFCLTAMAFLLIYRVLPNRNVSFKSATLGAVVAALLFEVAKRGFTYYVTHFPSQEAIYGAFASVPLFLLWIFLSWLIVLLGAEITRCHMIYRRYAYKRYNHVGNLFVDTFRLVGQIWRGQVRGDPVTYSELLILEPDMSDDRIADILRTLDKIEWIQRAEDGGWLLTRDLGKETLFSLYSALPGGLPLSEEVSERRDFWERQLHHELGKAFDSMRTAMQLPLREMYEPSAKQ